MTREQALQFLRANVPKENLVRHMLATEAVMRAVAERLGEDPETWGLAGLVHDCDLGQTEGHAERHGEVGAQMLREQGLDETICRAVRAHACRAECQPEHPMEIALCAADQVNGLIVAATLIHPSKRIDALKVKSLRKRMKERRFAASVDRDAIKWCERIDLPLDEFLGLAAQAMAKIAPHLGFEG